MSNLFRCIEYKYNISKGLYCKFKFVCELILFFIVMNFFVKVNFLVIFFLFYKILYFVNLVLLYDFKGFFKNR